MFQYAIFHSIFRTNFVFSYCLIIQFSNYRICQDKRLGRLMFSSNKNISNPSVVCTPPPPVKITYQNPSIVCTPLWKITVFDGRLFWQIRYLMFLDPKFNWKLVEFCFLKKPCTFLSSSSDAKFSWNLFDKSCPRRRWNKLLIRHWIEIEFTCSPGRLQHSERKEKGPNRNA